MTNIAYQKKVQLVEKIINLMLFSALPLGVIGFVVKFHMEN